MLDHNTLARQEREFARYDLDLSTKTMANWIINCADRYLKPLYQLMKEELLESRYIHCDESRIQVLGEPEQKGMYYFDMDKKQKVERLL